MRKKDGKPKAFTSFANKVNYTSFSNIRSEKIKCEYFSKHLLLQNLEIRCNASLNAKFYHVLCIKKSFLFLRTQYY